MKNIINIIKKDIKYYVFIGVWLIIYGSIKDNFTEGSTDSVVAYSVMWGIVILYTIYKTIKEVKRRINYGICTH